MKIAYISSTAFSDVDISLMSVLQKQINVHYYILIGPHNKKSCAVDFSKENISKGVSPATDYDALDKFKNIIDLKSVFIIYNPNKRGFYPNTFKVNLDVFLHIKKQNYNILHITTAPSYSNFWVYLLRSRIVLTVHDPIPHSSDNNPIIEFERRVAFKYLRHFILLNTAQTESFVKRYDIRKNRQTIYQSQLSCYSYLKIFDVEDKNQEDYILFFGNITSYKGLDYLLPAMKKVHQISPKLKLIIAGRGEYHFNIDKYKSLDYIEFKNYFIPDSELAKLINNSKFVVVPYIDATQSGVIMSAYAFCKPCIATNVGGLPEMVIDKKNGIIVPPKDIDSLAEAITSLSNDEELITSYENHIYQNYYKGDRSWFKIATDLIDNYKGILNK